MIIGRFAVPCHPERVEEAVAAMTAVEVPSRQLAGVLQFDVVRSLSDPNTLLAFEVFEDRGALARQNEQPEVAALLAMLEGGVASGPYEWTVWEGAAD